MKVIICDSHSASIPGVRFSHITDCEVYREKYFTITPLGLHTAFQSAENVVCGVLEGWHHVPKFNVLETHNDTETFVYTDGVAHMPVCDIVDGKPDLSTAQIVRIEAGTQVEVSAGKGHFVAVAEGDHFRTLVYCPNQKAERIFMEEAIESYN